MAKAWEDHKEVIVRQYQEQNKPLHVVRRFMEEQYKFKASTRAYRSRFDRWGVHKYSCRKPRNTTAKSGKLSAANKFPRVITLPQTPGSENTTSSSSPESPTMKPYFITGARGGVEMSLSRVRSTGLNLGFNSRSYCAQFVTAPTQHVNTRPVFIAHQQPRMVFEQFNESSHGQHNSKAVDCYQFNDGSIQGQQHSSYPHPHGGLVVSLAADSPLDYYDGVPQIGNSPATNSKGLDSSPMLSSNPARQAPLSGAGGRY
ncbi:Clr5 domain-containing protein [Cercophora scortea]|uniref:Clr5 domain-containing protein n=1 Tax=Cercophora scortea TaxID=314031 RepID=A0AAE0MGR5_9PEZI|nr:Clr5 domain-containing protein [Cercophora scortea]